MTVAVNAQTLFNSISHFPVTIIADVFAVSVFEF